MGTHVKQTRPVSELEQPLFPVRTHLMVKMFPGLEQNSIKPRRCHRIWSKRSKPWF